MKKYILLKCLILIGSWNLNAQLPTDSPMALSCAEAPIICNLDGYNNMVPYGTNATDQPSTFCANLHNNHWISFIAGTESLVLDITITHCGYITEAGGFFAMVFSVCESPWTSVSNCLYDVDPYSTATLTMPNLTIGEQYYLMVEGSSQFYDCLFSIDVTEGFTISPYSSAQIQADAGEDILFDCLTEEVTLDASNSTFGANDSIAWLNENSQIVSDSISFTTSEPGVYYFLILEDGGGCELRDEVEILSFNDILPSPFLIPAIEVYTDTIGQNVFLDAINSNEIDSSYILSWTTINGNIIAHADSLYPLISSSGNYFLEITHPETGCKISNQVFVIIIDPVSVFSPSKNNLNVRITPTITNGEVRVNYILEKTNACLLYTSPSPRDRG